MEAVTLNLHTRLAEELRMLRIALNFAPKAILHIGGNAEAVSVSLEVFSCLTFARFSREDVSGVLAFQLSDRERLPSSRADLVIIHSDGGFPYIRASDVVRIGGILACRNRRWEADTMHERPDFGCIGAVRRMCDQVIFDADSGGYWESARSDEAFADRDFDRSARDFIERNALKLSANIRPEPDRKYTSALEMLRAIAREQTQAMLNRQGLPLEHPIMADTLAYGPVYMDPHNERTFVPDTPRRKGGPDDLYIFQRRA